MRKDRLDHSVLKWLILVGLLWAQFAFAGHQLAHDADELGELCYICTSFDRFENALSDAGVADPIAAFANVLLPRFFNREVAGFLRVYSARASPQSPDSSS